MIDKLIVKSTWGAPQPYQQNRLTQIDIRHFLHTKSRPTTTYIASPLTGAQMEVRYRVENLNGPDVAIVEVEIPVASALVGHNYFHAGPEALPWEILCAGQLVRIALHAIGMTPDEIENYMRKATTVMAELTWHSASESEDGRKALQNRTAKYFRARRETSSRHDVQVADAEVIDSKSGLSTCVELKTGDQYLQYCKPEQLAAGKRKPRYKKAIGGDARERLNNTRKELSKHARNELRIREKSFQALNTVKPGLLKHAQYVEPLVNAVWADLGFGSRADEFQPAQLGSAAQSTLDRFNSGEDVLAVLPRDMGTRHRQEILNARGPDIALTGFKDRFAPANTGAQLSFAKRWKVPNEWLDLVVSDVTGPGLLAELQAGFAYLVHGELPDIEDAAAVKAWRTRWDKFRAAQHLDASCDTLKPA